MRSKSGREKCKRRGGANDVLARTRVIVHAVKGANRSILFLFLISLFPPFSMFASTIAEAAIVAATLGAPLPPSPVRVPVVIDAPMHSVHFFDAARNFTNRVLDRTIRADVVRVHTNLQTGEVRKASAKHNQAAVEEHCKMRFQADNLPNAASECGSGVAKNGANE